MKLLQKTNTFSVLTPNKREPMKPIEKVKLVPKYDIITNPIEPVSKELVDYDPSISSHTIIYPNKPINDLEGFLTNIFWGDIKGLIANQKDLIDYIKNNTHSGKSEWGFINGDITNQTDLINYLVSNNISYNNEYVDANNIKEALDLINDKLFYKLPNPLSVNFWAEYYRKNDRISTAYNGMIIDKIIYKWTINNYKDNIQSIYFNNKLTTEYFYTSTVPVTTNISATLKVISDFKDSKGNSPSPYSGSCSLYFNSKLFYWTSTDGNISDVAPNKNIAGSSLINLTTDLLEYIYLLFPSKKNWIHIYELGGVDPGGVVTKYVGEVSYKEYDNPVTYHLYRSTNALKGRWTIKYL